MSSPVVTSAATLSSTTDAEDRSRVRPWLRRPIAIVLIALVLRLIAMTAGHTYKFHPRDDHFGFGWETGRIARSIAQGDGFSSPFHGHTGPTAWVAPLYVYVVAGVFKLLGVYTYASAWVLLAMNCVFSALTAYTLYLITRAIVDEHLALITAWTWALLPYTWYWAIRWVWETVLTALLIAVAVFMALRMKRAAPRWRDWLLFGLLWGVIALTNPSVLTILPFVTIWIVWPLRNSPTRKIAGVALCAVVVAGCMSPWIVRNYRVFGRFIPVRSNFGAEFRMGNAPEADGLWLSWEHPSQDPIEFAKYQRLGEIAYAHQRGQEAVQFIAAHKAWFVVLCLKRFMWYWVGTPKTAKIAALAPIRNLLFAASTFIAFGGLVLLFRRRNYARWLFLIVMVVYPAIYYVTFPHPRYRAPIEPIMAVLGVYFIAEALRKEPDAPPTLP